MSSIDVLLFVRCHNLGAFPRRRASAIIRLPDTTAVKPTRTNQAPLTGTDSQTTAPAVSDCAEPKGVSPPPATSIPALNGQVSKFHASANVVDFKRDYVEFTLTRDPILSWHAALRPASVTAPSAVWRHPALPVPRSKQPAIPSASLM